MAIAAMVLFFLGITCLGNPMLALAFIAAGAYLAWKAGLFEPI